MTGLVAFLAASLSCLQMSFERMKMRSPIPFMRPFSRSSALGL